MKLDLVHVAELLGALSGLCCVALLTRQKIASWPLGIVNNALFCGLFWQARLYADATLQVVFLALAGYGWWQWSAPRGGDALRVRRTTTREWSVLLVLALGATAAAAYGLSGHTDSPAPLWDASVLTLSLAATYGQTKKLLESWWVWIAVDLLSIPLYAWRGLYPTALLYVLYLLLCVSGLRRWQRELAAAR
jgi:nicotinamide mononucleotide transporter